MEKKFLLRDLKFERFPPVHRRRGVVNTFLAFQPDGLRVFLPPLWFRGNIVDSHVAGPGLNSGRLNFFVGEIWATFIPGYLLAIIINRNHIHPSTDGDCL